MIVNLPSRVRVEGVKSFHFKMLRKFSKFPSKIIFQYKDVKKMMEDFQAMFKPVAEFSNLGTGRKKQLVLVGTTDDARTATFLFLGRIRNNWPSQNKIKILVHKFIETFDTDSKTIRGKRVWFFTLNEQTRNLWQRQKEAEKLSKWMETADFQDVLVIGDLIFEKTGSENRLSRLLYKLYKSPGSEMWNRQKIEGEIPKLSVRELVDLQRVDKNWRR